MKPNGGIHYTSTSEHKPSRFVDLRIENNEIYHVDRSGIFGWSDAWMRSKWNPGLGVIVRGNRLHDIGGDGIVVVATDGALVEDNVVGRANQRSEGYNVAIWAWSADNTVIQHNEAYGTKGQRDGEGFDSDGKIYACSRAAEALAQRSRPSILLFSINSFLIFFYPLKLHLFHFEISRIAWTVW